MRGVGLSVAERCVMSFKDAGKPCYSNRDCLSNKCVLEELEGKILPGYFLKEDVYGKCSEDNLPTYLTGEIIINDPSGSPPRRAIKIVDVIE